MVVMEIGYDDDVDEDLRDLLMERVGEFVDEDTDEVVDAVLLWWRDGDGDLVDTAGRRVEPARRQRRGVAADAEGGPRRARRAERDHRVRADRRPAADLDDERGQGLGRRPPRRTPGGAEEALTAHCPTGSAVGKLRRCRVSDHARNRVMVASSAVVRMRGEPADARPGHWR